MQISGPMQSLTTEDYSTGEERVCGEGQTVQCIQSPKVSLLPLRGQMSLNALRQGIIFCTRTVCCGQGPPKVCNRDDAVAKHRTQGICCQACTVGAK